MGAADGTTTTPSRWTASPSGMSRINQLCCDIGAPLQDSEAEAIARAAQALEEQRQRAEAIDAETRIGEKRTHSLQPLHPQPTTYSLHCCL